jgi:hypothetical protein
MPKRILVKIARPRGLRLIDARFNSTLINGSHAKRRQFDEKFLNRRLLSTSVFNIATIKQQRRTFADLAETA